MPRIATKKPTTTTTPVNPAAQIMPSEPTPTTQSTATTTAVVHKGFNGVTAIAPISPPSVGEKLPWLRFFENRARNSAAVRKAIPSVQDGLAYVTEPAETGDQISPIAAFQLVAAKEYFVHDHYDGKDYQTLGVRLHDVKGDKDYKRQIVAVVLAHVQSSDGVVLIPCVAVFKGPKAPAAQVVAMAVGQAGGDWRRVVGTPTTALKTGGKGYPYITVSADVRQINADEAEALRAWLGDADEQSLADKVLQAFQARCLELEKMIPAAS